MARFILNHLSTVMYKCRHDFIVSIVSGSWVLSVTASAYLRIVSTQEVVPPISWTQSYLFPAAALYSINFFILQLIWVAYACSLGHSSLATTMGCHLAANNLLHVAAVLSHACHFSNAAEVIATLGFANISVLYLWYTTRSRFLDMPALSGPLAWAIISFYWTETCAIPMSVAWPPALALCFTWAEFCCATFGALYFRSCEALLALALLSAATGKYNFMTQDDPKCWIPSLIVAMVFYGKIMVLTTMGGEAITQIMSPTSVGTKPRRDLFVKDYGVAPSARNVESPYGAC